MVKYKHKKEARKKSSPHGLIFVVGVLSTNFNLFLSILEFQICTIPKVEKKT